MRFISFIAFGSVVLGGCVTIDNGRTAEHSIAQVDEQPRAPVLDDPEAVRLFAEFEATMKHTMPIVDKVAILQLRDRYVRDVFIDTFNDPSLSPETRKQFQDAGGAYVTKVDEENTRELKRLMSSEFDIGEVARTSPKLFEQIFSIINHSPDKAFRRDVLATIEPLALAGDVEGELYATMFDRVRLTEGGKQRYGTQVKCVGGKYDVHELEEPELVDQRRASLKMVPLSVGVARNQAVYGAC